MNRMMSFLLAGLLVFSCKVVEENSTNSNSTSGFRLAQGEISGWSEGAIADKGYVEFTQSTMNEYVNGACQLFVDGGMVEGIQQIMKGSNSEQITSWVMDMSTAENATNLFQKIIIENVQNPQIITGLENVAIIDNSGLTGCTVYAHFGVYLIKAIFVNYGENRAQSLLDAEQFVKVYQVKFNNM